MSWININHAAIHQAIAREIAASFRVLADELDPPERKTETEVADRLKAWAKSHLSVVDASNLPLKPQSHVSAVILDEIKNDPIDKLVEAIEPLVGAENIDQERVKEAKLWSTKKITKEEWDKQHKEAIFSEPVDMDLPEPVMLEVAEEPAKKPLAPTSALDFATPVEPTSPTCSGCDKAARLYMNPTNFDHTCGTHPAEGLITHKNKSKETTINGARKPCKDCGLTCDRSDWRRRRDGLCSDCFKRVRDKSLADKIAKLNETEVRIGPDRNKPEPPKEAMNKLVSADYLLKRLKHDYPARGEFLVEDAMRITEMPFRDTLQLLQLIGEDRVKAISPAELKSQQKWKLVKETKNATN